MILETKRSILFVTNKAFLDSSIPGGVQLCTAEFISYFLEAGCNLKYFTVNSTKSITKRIKIKLGIDVYEEYDLEKYARPIVDLINENNIKLVVFNLINLSLIVSKIKPELPADVKFIALSHGNDSSDYLHIITKHRTPSLKETWKIGRQIILENKVFSEYLDGVIVINEHEKRINEWLGATNVFFLPRKLENLFIKWKPNGQRIGFVGTLDHLPNLLGLQYLAKALEKKNFKGELRIVGGPSVRGKSLQKQYPFITYLGPLDDTELIKEVGSWNLFLNPVFWFSRGASTKLAQAINWGLPIVSTPAGKRGYLIEDHSFVTPDHHPDTFAAFILKALDEPQFLYKLKESSEQNAIGFNSALWAHNLNSFLQTVLE